MLKYRYLYWQWLRREVSGRYRASLLGGMWLILQPLSQILVFTLIFFEFMHVRWPSDAITQNSGALHYGLNVFAGLVVFNFFAEIFGRAPTAILSQPNLVTKVRFPLLVLPCVTVGSAFIHILVGAALLMGVALLGGKVSFAWLILPLFVLPLLLYGLGMALALASVGVYLRDIGQIMPAVTSMLMFLTPIFYPLSAVPAHLKPWFASNPIGWGAESLRQILLNQTIPDFSSLLLHGAIALCFFLVALQLFNRIQNGFADVL